MHASEYYLRGRHWDALRETVINEERTLQHERSTKPNASDGD